MRKRNTTSASLPRSFALLFRLSLLTAIWHAPLPAIHWHVADHDQDAGSGSTHTPQLEIEFVLPCQLNGCEHSDPLHDDDSEDDHSTHIAAVGYGLSGDAEVDLVDHGIVVDELAAHASTAIDLASITEAALLESAHQTAGAVVPSLPLRADLQVFRI